MGAEVQGDGHVMVGAGWGDAPQAGAPGTAGGLQRPGEARKASSREPAEGVWPCGHRDWTSRAGKGYISVILSHPVCADLLQQL